MKRNYNLNKKEKESTKKKNVKEKNSLRWFTIYNLNIISLFE